MSLNVTDPRPSSQAPKQCSPAFKGIAVDTEIHIIWKMSGSVKKNIETTTECGCLRVWGKIQILSDLPIAEALFSSALGVPETDSHNKPLAHPRVESCNFQIAISPSRVLLWSLVFNTARSLFDQPTKPSSRPSYSAIKRTKDISMDSNKLLSSASELDLLDAE